LERDRVKNQPATARPPASTSHAVFKIRSFRPETNDSIAVSLAPSDRTEVRRYGILGGTHDDVLKLIQKLQAAHPGGPGFATPTVLVLLGELGPTFAEKFATAKHFGSWLGLCPDNRITGGKIYSVKTRDVKSRVATALRLGAQSLWQAKNYFGDLFRRWTARLGRPKAITAMAHKLARILWHLLKYKEAFNPAVFQQEEEKMQRKKLARLKNLAATLNYRLIEIQ